jgi:MoxR-like ATPase
MSHSNHAVHRSLDAINSVVLGKPSVTELAFATLLAKGSILIEDRPGLGKTTLAKTLARVLGLSFQRIQCTNDLLPMDILGRLDYAANRDKPRLIEGPIFASIVLLDELNRAPPRTQSAFLQAMEEGEITLEGSTFELPNPQMFIATQNPSDQVGTTLLPESELDRFTVRLSMGYPDAENEKTILRAVPQEKLSGLAQVLNDADLRTLQSEVDSILVSEAVLDLVVRFLTYSRQEGAMLSPRAGRDLVRVAQAMAFLADRKHVLPEDVKRSMKAVIEHRVKDADALLAGFSFQA